MAKLLLFDEEHFNVGSFKEFEQKIHFSLPQEIVRRYEQ